MEAFLVLQLRTDDKHQRMTNQVSASACVRKWLDENVTLTICEKIYILATTSYRGSQ